MTDPPPIPEAAMRAADALKARLTDSIGGWGYQRERVASIIARETRLVEKEDALRLALDALSSIYQPDLKRQARNAVHDALAEPEVPNAE